MDFYKYTVLEFQLNIIKVQGRESINFEMSSTF